MFHVNPSRTHRDTGKSVARIRNAQNGNFLFRALGTTICCNSTNRKQAVQYRLEQQKFKSHGDRLEALDAMAVDGAPVETPSSNELDACVPGLSHGADSVTPMEIDQDSADTVPTVNLPPQFIFIRHHPHAQKGPEIIPLESSPSTTRTPFVSSIAPDNRPYKPFKCFADYKFTSRAVKRRMPNDQIDEDLHDMHNGVWSSDCHITFHNHRDVEKSLAAARASNVPFHSESLVIDFAGRKYEVEVEFRDPWQIIKRWICDDTLMDVSTWFSQEKYLCLNGVIEFSNPLYDEPWAAETWRGVGDNLPDDPRYPSCFLGLHIWLDKGLVSTKNASHPFARLLDPLGDPEWFC
ncbi:hypothetical protein DFH08DRAFT_1008756 [Mycena albidolilacea]|uniref:Uncharacterized protein n=1 Tax=Mycena albidolilacea TaxID=1033008 RepID=A0AAD6ZZ46_9AGAR|nr:hypothetical protein DFH08DRAFT_1008756 [Mycena albidolilacea]